MNNGERETLKAAFPGGEAVRQGIVSDNGGKAPERDGVQTKTDADYEIRKLQRMLRLATEDRDAAIKKQEQTERALVGLVLALFGR